MAGFPTRLLRSSFGPSLRNTDPVTDPETDVGAEALNPLFWQVAGMNLIVPRASVIAHWTGSAVQVDAQFEAWNANNDQLHPTLARASTGVYTYTFAATYLDEAGTAVPVTLGAPRVTVHKLLATIADRVTGYAWKDASNPLLIHIQLVDASNAAADAPFWLEVS